MGKILLTIGLAGLCHAAYSATQHRNYLRLTEHEFTSLPIDILVQTLACLLLCCLGVIRVAAKFRPIQITSEWENKTWDNIGNRTSFYSFNHRGKYLFSGDDSDSNLIEEQFANSSEDKQREEELLRRRLIKEKQRLLEQQQLQQQQQQRQQRKSSSEEEGEVEENSEPSSSSEQEN